MKKRSILRVLLASVMALFMTVTLLNVNSYADDEPADPPATADEPVSGGVNDDVEGVSAGKFIYVHEDGTYSIVLDAFSTGEVQTTYEVVPCDIILVLDTSTSLTTNNMSSTTSYTAVTSTSGNISLNRQNQNTSYYYKNGEDDYRQITVTRSGWFSNDRTWTIAVSGKNGNYEIPNVSSDNLSISNLATAVGAFMGESGAATLYTATTTTKTRMEALQDAVKTFLGEVADNNAKTENPADYSKVSIVTFDETSSVITGSKQANANSFVGVKWNDAHDKVVSTQTTAVDMFNLVDTMSAHNWTYTHLGMNNAVNILESLGTSTKRKHIVVLFTDGVPCSTGGGDTFNHEFAVSVINSAKDIKDPSKYGATMYTIAVYPGADPAVDPTTATGTNNVTLINKLLHAASSNFPSASAALSSGTMSITFGTRDTKAQHYFVPTTADELKKIFETIGQSSGSTKTPLTAETVMKDIVSSSFTLPPGATEDDITVKIVPWDSTIHNWSTTTSYDIDGWKNACMSYGATAAENVSVVINGSTVDITGFDYAKHFRATTDEELDTVGGVNKNTAKLNITFDIMARPSAVTGGTVATNGADSGLYVDGKPVVKFKVPEVVFTPVTYVVDYVTSDTSTDTKASSVKLDYSGVLDNVDMLDKPDDDVLQGVKAENFTYTIYKGRYGTISYGDDEVDVQRRYVRYAPTTMNWDGYDRIFVKGPSATDSSLDVWAMLCVLPANNVFYEDTYITQEKTVTYNGNQVTIAYTGINYDSSWDLVGTEGLNQTYHAGDDMGWIVGLADDTGYANDMSHKTSTSKAKATFTFSGTGLDIYSRTNGATGMVSITVKSAAADNASGAKVAKTQVIDTKAAAGDFFAIPVCTFTDLPYGKYTATITVTSGAKSEGRMTFYLDGVRVYNPIQPLEGDGNVEQMYGDKNMGAVFTEVRSLLATEEQTEVPYALAEALYIDEHTTNTVVDNLAEIEDAKQKLAKAQSDRDDYVNNTITPAKNAVSAEEYALSSAKSALTNATNVYNAAKSDYETAAEVAAANPDDAAAAAAAAAALTAMNKAEAKMAEADEECEAAQLHYDQNYDDLVAVMNQAIAGKDAYDTKVNQAIAYYDEVNGGVEVAVTTNDIATYNKEGPKSEVLLSNGQSVAINVEAGKTYYVGLRSLKGDETSVTINGQTVTYKVKAADGTVTTYDKIKHTTDLYYECVPVDGKIVIKNTGNGILSVTKLRTTGAGNKTSGTKMASAQETLEFVRSLAKMSASEYTGEVLTEDGNVVDDPSIIEGSADETELVLGEDDIIIENPDADVENETADVASALSKLLSSFFGFFRR